MELSFKKALSLKILFSIILIVFLLLFSFKLVMLFTSFTPPQQSWLNYFSGNDVPDGYERLEVLHMQDVKQVLDVVDYLFYILLVILVYFFSKKEYRDFRFLRKLAIIKIVGGGLFFLFSILFFDFLFTWFHKIFFPQGNWQFPAGSLLIATFPLDFFVNISRNIFIVFFFIPIIFILACFIKKKCKGYK